MMSTAVESREDLESWIEESHPHVSGAVKRFLDSPLPEEVEEEPKRQDRSPEYDRGRRSDADWRTQTWPYPKKKLPLEDDDGDAEDEGLPS